MLRKRSEPDGHFKDISSILKISIDTVKSHLRHVFAKMDVETRAEAVSEAIHRGLATS